MDFYDSDLYIELAQLVEDLPVVLTQTRAHRGLTIRHAAEQIGVAPSTVYRIEHHGECGSRSIARVLRWAAASR